MAVLFHGSADGGLDWPSRMRAALPGEDFRFWPDVGDPADIDIAILWRQPPGGLAPYPNLKTIQSFGAGINQLDLPSIPPHIRMARLVDDRLSEQMAEYCLLSVLRHYRQFDQFEQDQRTGTWQPLPPRDRASFPVGIMGFGVLGTATARLLALNGFHLRGWARTPKQIAGIDCFAGAEGLTGFLDGLKALICLLPLTPATTGILNARLFERLDSAYLVNAARGGHLVDQDLIDALGRGRIAGATLDVFHQEPPAPDHPFWRHPAILMTPHIASITNPVTAVAIFVENIRRARAGAPLLNEVDRQQGY
ncbi:MAG TPA: glyoxylate/hydroxypyruvate reductase A [Stellaceae bacterium]|nr:glyoxylate/hydroxypyruvate reductase A [Stellaceae bacterium]